MTSAYRVDPEKELVLLRPTGRFTESEFITLCEAAYGDPQRAPSFAHVWDTREIDELVMDASVIPMYQQFLSENEDAATRGRVAIIASRDLTRTFATMLIEVSRQHPATFRLFDTWDEAAEWIGASVDKLSTSPGEEWVEV